MTFISINAKSADIPTDALYLDMHEGDVETGRIVAHAARVTRFNKVAYPSPRHMVGQWVVTIYDAEMNGTTLEHSSGHPMARARTRLRMASYATA